MSNNKFGKINKFIFEYNENINSRNFSHIEFKIFKNFGISN